MHVFIRLCAIFYVYFSLFLTRSLQLTERSPNRNKMHKTVVQISGGSNGQKERTVSRVASTSANRRYVNSNNGNNNGANNRLAVKERQYKDLRTTDLEKSRSLDSEYDRYQGNAGRTEFDQSRSFDENYSEQVAQSKYLDSYANNVKQTTAAAAAAVAQPPPLSDSQSNNYDSELVYDKSRKSLTRSPLIGYKHEPKNQHAKMHSQSVRGKRDGERSPNLNRDNIYRSITKSFDHLQSAIASQQQQIQSASMQAMREHSPTKRAHSQNHMSALVKNMSPGSDYDLNASDFNVSYDIRGGKGEMLSKEAKLMSDYYFGGGKTNTESYSNQRRREMAKASPQPPSARYLRN